MNIPDAKNRILNAALQVFAEKSFEGARIDEIAEKANVPKSLIYYHFKNKGEILNFLFDNFIYKYTELIKLAENDTHKTKEESFSSRENLYKEFYTENTDLIRIILLDSFKKSSSKPVIFKIIETMINAEESFEIAKNNEKYNRAERLIAEFFTNIMPTFSFFCFLNSWVEHFKIDKKNMGQLFSKIMSETHGAYHRNHK